MCNKNRKKFDKKEFSEFGAVQRNENLIDLEKSSKLLRNEYLVAKIGVNTAENEPSKVSRQWGGPKCQFPGSLKKVRVPEGRGISFLLVCLSNGGRNQN